MTELISVEKPISFMLGGNADFSIENMNTGTRYSYLVQKSKDNENLYFVKVKESGQHYIYAGTLYKYDDGSVGYKQGKNGNYAQADPPIRGLLYIFKFNDRPIPPPMLMFHHGRCSVCGKRLTDAESIRMGIGPTCRKKIGLF